MKVHLVSFADGTPSIVAAGERLFTQAKNSTWFDSVTIWDLNKIKILDQAWHLKHHNFIKENRRGFGYWIWKSKIIHLMMEIVPKDDLIVYLDAGCEINTQGHEKFKDYLEIAKALEIFCFYLDGLNYQIIQWTKKELLDKFHIYIEDTLVFQPQIEAGFLVLRNSENCKKLIKKWSTLSTEDNYILSNDIITCSQSQDFVENRHDQAILSLLLYTADFGCTIRNENYFPNAWKKNTHPLHYPIAAFRNLSGTSRINEMHLI